MADTEDPGERLERLKTQIDAARARLETEPDLSIGALLDGLSHDLDEVLDIGDHHHAHERLGRVETRLSEANAALDKGKPRG